MELKYLAVYHQIKEKILKQIYKVNDSVGTEQELAEIYGVSRITVRRALGLLKEEGFIESKQGSGNRVLPIQYNLEPDVKKEGMAMEFLVPKPWKVMNSVVAVDIVNASAEQAGWFHIDPGTELYRVQHLRYINEKPFGYISTFYLLSSTPGIENKQVTVPVSMYVRDTYGLEFDRREDIYTADMAKFKEMQYLNVALGDPLLCNIRFRYCKEQMVEISEYKINAKIARFRYNNPSDDLLMENNL